jgi:hypothetical protein
MELTIQPVATAPALGVTLQAATAEETQVVAEVVVAITAEEIKVAMAAVVL